MAYLFVVVRVGIHTTFNSVHVNTNRPCARSVGVSAVDVETLELHGVCRAGQPLGDGDGAVVVGPPDAGALEGDTYMTALEGATQKQTIEIGRSARILNCCERHLCTVPCSRSRS